MSRNSLKTARILEYYTFFPLQQAIREARHKRVLKEDRSGWHVIVKMPNGERISHYIKKKSCYQVQAHANFKCTYLWEYYFYNIEDTGTVTCYSASWQISPPCMLCDRYFNLKEMDCFNCLKKLSIVINY